MTSANTTTQLWARRDDLAVEINESHTNSRYLPDFILPAELAATSSLEAIVSSSDVIVMAVPSHGYREVARAAAAYLRPWVPIVSLSKGLERESQQRMSEVTEEEMSGHPVAVLTGPNLAKEIMHGQPAASVVAIDDSRIAGELQRLFSTPSLRVYTNPDVIGCEVAGVVKNVIAIASGMAQGMGFGDNTRATLITRGLAEMTRLGLELGGRPGHFCGAGRNGRPDRHLCLDAESEQYSRVQARSRRDGRRNRREHEHGRRGGEVESECARTRPSGRSRDADHRTGGRGVSRRSLCARRTRCADGPGREERAPVTATAALALLSLLD